MIARNAIIALTLPTSASAQSTLYPERIGAETARYYRGQPAVSLRQPTGTIEVRPVRVEKGKAMFALAVFNEGAQAANFGIENILASVNAIPVGLPTYQQLVADAEDKARGARIGTIIAAGALAGIASTASNRGTYVRHVSGPRRSYTRVIHWRDDTPAILGATAAIAGGAMVMRGIDRKLDYTLDQLGAEILQTTTVDPGSSFGGLIVVPIPKDRGFHGQIQLTVMFNGTAYPFAFRLTPPGAPPPAPLPATALADGIPPAPPVVPQR